MILVLFAQLRCRPPAGAKIVSGRQGRHLPTSITQRQQAVTACLARIRLALPGQRLYHTLTLTTQRSEEHTSELQSRENLVCRLLLEKKNHHTARPHTNSPSRSGNP